MAAKKSSTKGNKGGSTTPTKKDDLPRNVAAEDQPRAAEEAASLPLRAKNPDVPAPVRSVKGEPVEVARPGRLAPEPVRNLSDALVKDRLRADGNPEAADAPVRRHVGGDWRDQDVKF